MNRYDLTHWFWCMVAPLKCDISMCPIARRYPETNYTTIVEFEDDATFFLGKKVIREEFIKRGWKAEDQGFSKNGTRVIVIDMIGQLTIQLTPYIARSL